MANRDPLQPGDGLQGVTPTGGDMWKVGQPAPSLSYSVDRQDPGANDEVIEVDSMKYGDAFDPTAPTRVRNVGSAWQMDTDHDGDKN